MKWQENGKKQLEERDSILPSFKQAMYIKLNIKNDWKR